MDSLVQVRKYLIDSVEVLNQLTVQGQKNIWATYTLFSLLNGSIAEIDKELETEQLNKEKVG